MKKILSIVVYQAGTTVGRFRRMLNGAPEQVADTLVSEAYPQ